MTVLQRDRSDSQEARKRKKLTWVGIAILGTAAAFAPLEVVANNPHDIGHPERILILIGLLWVSAILAAGFLVRRGARPTSATYSVFLVTVLMMRGGALLSALGEVLGWVVLVVLPVVATYLISRIERHDALDALFLALCAFLIAGPVTSLVREASQAGIDETVHHDGSALALSHRPDIFLVVLDGYAGNLTLESDFGLDRSTVIRRFEKIGFEVPVHAWSAYPATRSSLPSLLDMSFPLESGGRVTALTEKRLSDMIGGSNSVSSILRAEGYELVMVESGWSGSRCGPEVDICIPAPIMDEAMFSVAERSLVGKPILRSMGYAFTVGAQHTMTWLDANGPSLSEDSRPSFVFAHVMVPHPPFFLDDSCRTRFGRERNGVQFVRPGDELLERRSAYLEQTECVDEFVLDLTGMIEPDDVVVVVGDHGTDQRNQLVRDPETWSRTDLEERFNVFLAVRDGAECSVGDPVILPNIFRRVLSCIANPDLEDLEPRMFKYAGVDDPAPEVSEVAISDVSSVLSS